MERRGGKHSEGNVNTGLQRGTPASSTRGWRGGAPRSSGVAHTLLRHQPLSAPSPALISSLYPTHTSACWAVISSAV